MSVEITAYHELPEWMTRRMSSRKQSQGAGSAATELAAPRASEVAARPTAEDCEGQVREAARALHLGDMAWPADPSADGFAETRPMPCLRLPGELVSAMTTVATREVHDARYGHLRRGVQAAANWVLGFTDVAPVLGAPVPLPNFGEVVEEYGRAVQVAAGYRRLPDAGWSDADRIVGRGMEMFLLWYAWPDVPAPPVLNGSASVRDIFAGIGDVGFDVAGLNGPQISRLRFPPLPGSRLTVDTSGKLVTV